jgi:hypothetical protein
LEQSVEMPDRPSWLWERHEWYLGIDGVMYRDAGLTMPITVEEAIAGKWDFAERPRKDKVVKPFAVYRLRD